MNLGEFCASLGDGKRGFSEMARRLAREAGVNRGPEAIRRYCLPEGHPEAQLPRDRAIYRAIHKVTNGAVTPNAIIGLPESAPP